MEKYQKWRKWLGINVLDAAKQRVSWTFDNFPKIYVSFSGGKDSTCMLHLVMDEAIKRNKKIGVLFVDLEGQYKLTIDHIQECYDLYAQNIEPYWVALPLHLRNAVSQFQPHWVCWDANAKQSWIRQPPKMAIIDRNYFPFFRDAMEFEEFVPEFGHWYGKGQPTACFVGIRTEESLNRWRTLTSSVKQCLENKKWTTWCGKSLYNIYPIYDWKTKDDWTYIGKNKLCYNRLYDRMYQAGMTIHQMRICQPYGDDQRKGLWLFQVVEPETWAKVLARVNGANQGALYAQENGNILGVHNVVLPPNHTWKSFCMMILDTMPNKTAEHFRNKIAVFLKWYESRGFRDGIPDDGPMDKSGPSWKRICKMLLKNDYWAKGLSFTQHKSASYEKYLKLMKKRREQWGLI
jgi:predicted phosphoadenosine phosphosulfate sulfurtransferase